MIQIRPTLADDFRRLRLGHYDAISLPGPGILPTLGQVWAGHAVSAVEDGAVLGIAGVIVYGDEGAVTMLLSDELRRRPYFLHRFVSRHLLSLMERRGLRRLHATAHRELKVAQRWLEQLGFRYDGRDDDLARYVYERG